ncbi:MAG: metallophosphoesterase family protein [Sandaracinaceae bacterium]|nr:metallophosphoesterase family protein [Sandaracinaceae bacterium]
MRIGVVGDVHLAFDAIDVERLDALAYTAILFVGDIAGYFERGGLETARVIAQLSTPAIVIPGNHDAAHVGQMAAEVLEAEALVGLMNVGQPGRERALADALSPAVLAGYSRHRLDDGERTVDVIAARPHSAGGPRLAFRPHLAAAFGVEDFEDSRRLIEARVAESDADDLIFLAHNGPTGLGARRDDIWGCDFRDSEGDFGDPDLEYAIGDARELGKPVRAVIAGHMHHALRGGGLRPWRLERDGVLYVNAARVPRIFEQDGRTLRHHVELIVDADRVRAREVLTS